MNRVCSIWTVIFCGLFADVAGAVQTVSEPFLGVTLYHRTETSPRPLNINVVEIDLSAPGISFLVTPRGPAPQPVFNGVADETVIQTPRQFVNSSGVQLAVNASFYAIGALHTVNGQTWTNNLGLTVSNGDAYSPWQPLPHNDNNYDAALNITATNQASILKMPSSVTTGFETNPTGVALYNTVTGKNRLWDNSVLKAPAACGSFCDVNPRTAAGLTAGNTKLLLMTIDGRQTGFSEGVTLVELAGYIAEYGATNAINLDGGGSTQVAANYYGDGASAKLVNVPSEAERSVGTSLGVFALPSGDYNQNGAVDTGDYLVWRSAIGGQLAFDEWRERYGTVTGNGSMVAEGAAVTESGVCGLIAVAVLCSWFVRLPRQT